MKSELWILSLEPLKLKVNPLTGELFRALWSDCPETSKEHADPLCDKSSSYNNN